MHRNDMHFHNLYMNERSLASLLNFAGLVVKTISPPEILDAMARGGFSDIPDSNFMLYPSIGPSGLSGALCRNDRIMPNLVVVAFRVEAIVDEER